MLPCRRATSVTVLAEPVTSFLEGREVAESVHHAQEQVFRRWSRSVLSYPVLHYQEGMSAAAAQYLGRTQCSLTERWRPADKRDGVSILLGQR